MYLNDVFMSLSKTKIKGYSLTPTINSIIYLLLFLD